MSLFGSIQLAKNSLIAQQIGLQVTGNNIANANTPGYIRQRVVLTPAASQERGDLVLGLGVEVQAVVQQFDRFLAQRFRDASSELASSEAHEDVYLQLESLLGELSDTDLSTSLNDFFGSINDILNQPESVTVRNLAVLQGQTLTDDIRRLDERVRQIRTDLNTQVSAAADEVNSIVADVSRLNVQIVESEGGGTRGSDAVGLRDRREVLLDRLASLIDIRVTEGSSGAVTVYSGSDFLVSDGTFREVNVGIVQDRGLATAHLQLKATSSPLAVASGEVAGLIESRDQILGGFLDQLQEFGGTLIHEFNRVFSSGQGLTGYSQLQSEFRVDDSLAALDQAGLAFTPINGSFQVQVRNKQSGLVQTTDINVVLHGLDGDTSLSDLATALNEVDGLTASITAGRGLDIRVDSPELEFAFADDTSGVLASLGIATFFAGSDSANIQVNSAIRNDASKFAASQSGIGGDAENALAMVQFLDKPLETQNGGTLSFLYDRMVGETVQSSSVARSVAEGFRVFQRSLESSKLGVSGVSIDEEAVNMITYQRAFQASARMISTISDLLDVLVSL